MGTLMQMLLEALRANVGERNNGSLESQEPSDEMSGFILENVRVATMPYIEYDGENEVNPLEQFAHNKGKAREGRSPQNMNNILDHLVRLEEKVKVLEQCVPPKKYRQRIWLAPSLSNPEGDEDSGFYPDEEEELPEKEHSPSERSEKGHSPKKGKGTSWSQPSGNHSGGSKSGHRITATKPIRLEKEERSCFARLLFSRCWTTKDDGAGWRIKRRCPTHGSLSCPCGKIGPCKNVKANACPVDQLKSTKPTKSRNKRGAVAVSEGATFAPKPGGPKKKFSSSSKVSQKTSKHDGKPLIEKLLPCCFKDHTHNECCCRCKDHKAGDHKKSMEKSSVSKPRSNKSLPSESKANEEDSEPHSEEASEEDEQSAYDDEEAEVQAFNVRSFSDFSPLKRELMASSGKRATGGGDIQMPSKRKSGNKKNLHRIIKDPKSRKRPETSAPTKRATKSTTSFQITLHPVLPEGELPEPEVVRHQILKTLSTIHGPVKVEQKIVVQGSKNSVVIVTHGEACQCNLCNMLKGKLNHHELVEGSPQVVKISTNKGCNTLINHSDGCKCDLCGVLDPAVGNNPEKIAPKPRNETLVVAACSSTNEVPLEMAKDSTPAASHPTTQFNQVSEPRKNRVHEGVRKLKIHSLGKKSYKDKNAGKKAKKCRCTKCRQRRRVERLKLRLKKEMGSEEYETILREITRHRDENDQKTFVDVKPSVQSDSDEDYVAPKKTKKSVSFSDDPDPQYYPEIGGPHVDDGFCGRKGKCVLCEELKMNDAKLSKTDKRKNKIESSPVQNDSTVYSVNASSEESERLVYGSGIPKDGIELRSKSKTYEKGVYYISDEQKCFPPKHMPETPRKKRAPAEKRLRKEISEELHFPRKDAARCVSQQESGCSGRYRQEGARHEGNHVEQPEAILLQEGAFPQKFVYWSPPSRSNMATAHSSESYYVPDQDEFPIVNMEVDESIPSSGMNTDVLLHRVQIPVWFRMLPDRSSR